MNKLFIALAIIFGVLFISIFVCRLTGAMNYYTIATPGNEPAFKKGDVVFSSIFKKPKRFDFIFYKHIADHYYETATWIHRLCGLPGDKIQLVNGELFVNDQPTEFLFNTYHAYFMAHTDLDKLNKYESIGAERITPVPNDSFMVALDKKSIKTYKVNARIFYPEDYNDEIFKMFHQHWTADNFGPFMVPNDSYFVLGDNRNNSLDSRYTGCITKENFVATVLSSK